MEFDSAPKERQVAIRDRIGNTTTGVPMVPTSNGSISDNGCVIAYISDQSQDVGSGSFYNVFAFDRCVGVNMPVGVGFTTGFATPSPKPNQDGSVIVWASSNSLDQSIRSGNTYTQGTSIIGPDSGIQFGQGVAISDDGLLVAFESTGGVINLLDRRTPGSIELISMDESGNTISNASDPSISGDGRLVTYSFRLNDNFDAVFLRDRGNAVSRAIAVPARSADISRDGKYIAYTLQGGEVGDIFVARSTSNQPFETFETDLVSYVDGDPGTSTNGSASNAAISGHGRWVSFDSYAGHLLVPGQGFLDANHVFVRQRRPAVTVDSINYGTVGGPTDRQATVRSVGMAGFVITSITATGDFTVVGENCPAVLDPGASCVVTVRFGANDSGQKTGVLAVRDNSYSAVPLEGTGRLIGVIDRQIPPVTIPPPADVGLAITPAPVVFGDVVVGSAAPERPASVSNTGDVPITVNSIVLSGSAAGDFLVASDACTGVSLSPGATCELVLGFTATASGGRTATVTANGSSSTSASAALRGSGRFDAELDVTPTVAAGGQVVTVIGSGFPPSTTIEIVLGGDSAVSVATDASGGFMLPWLILTGVPQGELLVDDVAVVGVFDAEPSPLLVVPTPMRPQGTATLSRTGRTHVSR